MEIKIGIAYHKDTPIISNDIYIPIHVGKALNPSLDLHIQPDNEGDNISEENGYYCELTATYWLWKNVDSDYKGICHYRRVFSLHYSLFDVISNCISFMRSRVYMPQKKYKDVKAYVQDALRGSEKFKNILNEYPIIAPKKIISMRTLYSHFVIIGDDYINVLKDVVATKYPNVYGFVVSALDAQSFYYANMVIMRDDYFNEYCEFLFDILESVKEKMLSEKWILSTDELIFSRKLGYLAEILTNTYLLMKESDQVPIKKMVISFF